MNETTINATAWTPVIASSSTDIILQPAVPVRLCFGSSSGIPLSRGISIGGGEMMIIPVGVDVSAVAVGGQAGVIVTGPFGS